MTADAGLTTTPAISRDGKMVAYASDRASDGNLDLWVHPLTAGAQAIRLTRNEADDMMPDFSPDGGQIVFHSRRDDGGVYVIPALGGEERLLVRGGQYPRFSPDGKRVAYSVGGFLNSGSAFVIPAGGGAARRVASNLNWAERPHWSAAGKSVLVFGSASEAAPPDWWLAPVDGGAAVETGVRPYLQFGGGGWSWSGSSLIVSSESRGLWRIDLDRETGKRAGAARRITHGTARESWASTTLAGSPMVFVSGSESHHLWSLRLDANLGKVDGEAQAWPHAGGSQTYPAASANGKAMVYVQTDPNGSSVRRRDLTSGKENAVTSQWARPRLSPDGTQVAYSDRKTGIYGVDAAGGEAAQWLRLQGRWDIYGWSPDGRYVVYWYGDPIRFALLDVATRQSRDLISHLRKHIHGAELSPDGRWVTFHVRTGATSPLYIAAVRNNKAADESEWIEIAGGLSTQSRPWWSPDGKLLYYISTRDTFSCIWAQRLDESSKRPSGEPFAVYHFHHARRSGATIGAAPFGPAILPDRLIFSLREEAGNIWLATRR